MQKIKSKSQKSQNFQVLQINSICYTSNKQIKLTSKYTVIDFIIEHNKFSIKKLKILIQD